MNSNEKKSEQKIKKKRVLWSPEAESILIDLWEERIPDLRGSRKNSHVYQEIALEFEVRGIRYSGGEVKMKIQNMTKKYKDEKNKVGVSGGSPSEWQFYSKVHEFLGHFKSLNIEDIMEDNTAMWAYPSESEWPVELLRSSTPLECISLDSSNPSTSLPTDSPLHSNPSTSLPTDSPLHCRPSCSAPKKKRSLTSFQQEILQSIKESNSKIELEMKSIANIDTKIVELQEKSLDIETERNKIFEKISTDSANFQSELLHLLKKNRNEN